MSEGIGTNKLVSAVASKLTKPAAFYEVAPGHEASFLHPLPNKWLPGIGPQTSVRLNAAGLAEIRHIAGTPLEMLKLLLGNQAETVRKYSNGIDERPLIPEREPQKTFSEQQTFPADLTDEEYIKAVLLRMADNLFSTVRNEARSIRTLTVKVRTTTWARIRQARACRSLRIWKRMCIASFAASLQRHGSVVSACGSCRSSSRTATGGRI